MFNQIQKKVPILTRLHTVQFLLTLMVFGLLGIMLGVTKAHGADVTLRIHHFMSQKAPSHTSILVPLKEALESKSGGRIQVEIYDSMSLGGGPPDLYDQAVDGAVDIILTLPGYTPGKFNRTEVFELPFIMNDSVATSKAFWDLVQSDLQKTDFKDTKILGAWVHGPGVVHSKTPINKLEDMAGKELRGPTRVVTDLLGELGAIPVGMPLPKIPENISKGVISGALIPWEITTSIRLAELVSYHTELKGDYALYTATFVLAMNQYSYDRLPSDLRKILDEETGKKISALAGKVLADADAVGRKIAVDRGNTVISLSKKEVQRWEAKAKPVYAQWLRDAKSKDFNGNMILRKARAYIKKNK